MSHYLYGLTGLGTGAPSEPGVGGAGVVAVPADERLAVLCSPTEATSIQPRRAHLVAHDRVLAAAMDAGPVLPLRFGLISDDDPAAVLEGMDTDAIVERMRILAGKVEVQLLWEPDGDVALRRVVQRRPEVRDRATSAVDRGRMIAQAVQALATEDLSAITDELAGSIDAVDTVRPRGSSARVATLVAATRLGGFLQACDRLAERTATAGTLRTVGGLPPYSFAGLDREPVRT